MRKSNQTQLFPSFVLVSSLSRFYVVFISSFVFISSLFPHYPNITYKLSRHFPHIIPSLFLSSFSPDYLVVNFIISSLLRHYFFITTPLCHQLLIISSISLYLSFISSLSLHNAFIISSFTLHYHMTICTQSPYYLCIISTLSLLQDEIKSR
jgi:hypothetical protein